LKEKETNYTRDRGDLLRFPLVMSLLGSPRFITSLQVFTLALFVLALYKGCSAPHERENLFTTGLFWGLFWPFFIFITTPLFGKIFCALCPHRLIIFSLGERFGLNNKAPRWMTAGYASIIIVLIFYWFPVYAWKGIFHSPLNTSIYFTVFTFVAVAISIYYRPRVWCKGLCPVALPTNIVSRAAFFGIRSYKSKCDSCRKATCVAGRTGFEGCPHGINPSKLTENSDCTLCMKCIKACSHDAVSFGFLRPMSEFALKGRKGDMPEALGLLLLFGALTLTMQLYNGLYRGALKDRFFLAKVGSHIQPYVDFAVSREGAIALSVFFFSITTVTLYFFLFSHLAAWIAKKEMSKVFEVFAWTLLPAFAFSSFSQMSEFFFFRYYPMIADGFLSLFGYGFRVKPLASMNSLWLTVFKLIAMGGAMWSIILTWQASRKFAEGVAMRVIISLPFCFFHLFILIGFTAHMVVMIFLDMPQVTGPRQ